MANEEYKFPDETDSPAESVNTDEDNIKVEVIDDTPEEDRGRKPLPKEIVDEIENDPLDEYSDRVKKRFSQLKKVWHDERREKERAAREKEEALNFAQRAYEENKQLKQRLGQGEKILADQFTKDAESRLVTAREKLKAAYESGDADKITEAQELLTDAKFRAREVEGFRPSLQRENNEVQKPQQEHQPPVQVDRKAEAWRQKNQWFGENRSMTAFALGLHDELVASGVDPRSDEYYDKVNSTMKKRFSDYFGDEQNTEADEKPAPRKATTVVAPATRSSAPRQVRLTASAVAIAKKLGVSPEVYAREVLKLENGNG